MGIQACSVGGYTEIVITSVHPKGGNTRGFAFYLHGMWIALLHTFIMHANVVSLIQVACLELAGGWVWGIAQASAVDFHNSPHRNMHLKICFNAHIAAGCSRAFASRKELIPANKKT